MKKVYVPFSLARFVLSIPSCSPSRFSLSLSGKQEELEFQVDAADRTRFTEAREELGRLLAEPSLSRVPCLETDEVAR